MITVQLQLVDHWTTEPVSDADVTITLKVAPWFYEDAIFHPDTGWEKAFVVGPTQIFTGGVTSLAAGTFMASFEIGQDFFEPIVDAPVARPNPLGTVEVAVAVAGESRTLTPVNGVELSGPDHSFQQILDTDFIIWGRCRALFGRYRLAEQAISLRNALLNHPTGLAIGLREAHRRFVLPHESDGFARGCRVPSSIQITVPGITTRDVAHLAPSWAPIADEAPRTVEGVLAESRIARTDFPFHPWHETYDWCFILRADPQYTYLVGKGNSAGGTLFELEWETKGLPSWAWPMQGSRLWAVGRWIYDCSHYPDAHSHRTELHPLKAVASFRRDSLRLPDNTGVTRTTRAAVFIGQEGGYLRQPINDQDYAFDLPLPPKPHPAAEPRFEVHSMTGPLPVEPRIAPFPADAPGALRVVIPLKGVEPHPEQYGVIIHGGWTDPAGAEAAQMRHLRVAVERIFIDSDLDNWASGRDEWHVYVGINGRWQSGEKTIRGDSRLSFEVPLDLHPDDPIEIAVCGFEADILHDFMGHRSGVSARLVGNPTTDPEAREVAGKVRYAFLQVLTHGKPKENDEIGLLFASHGSDARGSFTAPSLPRGGVIGNYRLGYRIEDR